ncbi:hypothetical protein GOP47_0020350 [Adiantum capillus-veneris]|uniref:Uncharacterized protein n=1 Tax=Adiantum capillus-veneris TaxID=13818 RepID=A0A9D4UD89_ADICA|nr:hypothetical protein GOP47_0020350 [Adiantum capillus-veneris]
MRAGILGVFGDLMSVALLCFLFSLALQLYCAIKRQTRLLTTLPSAARTPPPQQPTPSCNQLYMLRIQRSTSCPVLSQVAHQRPVSSPTLGHVSEQPCAFASEAGATADLAKLMQAQAQLTDSKDGDVEEGAPAAPRLLFTIKEEVKEEEADVQEQAEAASLERGSPTWQRGSTSGGAGPGLQLVSQGSSASSEGGAMWSLASSPAVSYFSASSSPLLMISTSTSSSTSPPRSSFWAPSLLAPNALS